MDQFLFTCAQHSFQSAPATKEGLSVRSCPKVRSALAIRPLRMLVFRRFHSYRLSIAVADSSGIPRHSDNALLTASTPDRIICSVFDDMLSGRLRYPTRYSETSPNR